MTNIQRLKQHLNYGWRVLATGISFCLFGIGAMIIGYVITPLISLLVRDNLAKKRYTQRVIHYAFKCFRIIVQGLGLITFEFKQIDKLKQDTGCILACNHPTLIDYVIMISLIKSCDVVVKAELLKNPFVKKVIQNAQYIPNTQSSLMFESVQNTKTNQTNLLIFPEGTRTTPGQAMQLQRGTANIAVRLNMPIRLIHIFSSESGLTKHHKWYKIPTQKVQYHISIGQKIDPKPFLRAAVHKPLAARKLTAYIANQLQKGCKDG